MLSLVRFYPWVKFYFWAACESNAQSKNGGHLDSAQQKDKMVDRTPRRLCIFYSSFIGSNFCREGTGHFRLSGKQIWKSIWTNTKLLQGVIGPVSTPNDSLNTVFNDVVSLCESCRNNALPRSPWEKLSLVAILRVKSLSLQLKEEFAICRLGYCNCNIQQKWNWNLICFAIFRKHYYNNYCNN